MYPTMYRYITAVVLFVVLALQGIAPVVAATPTNAPVSKGVTQTAEPAATDATTSLATDTGNRHVPQPENPDDLEVKLIVIIRPGNKIER
jgi:hypothetical protein